MEGKPQPFLYPLANWLYQSKVQATFGLVRTVFPLFGAAPIAQKTRDYFASLGLPLHSIYGMSETSASIIFSTPKKFDFTRLGCILPGLELKILNPDPVTSEGELCYRGRAMFMGYY